MTVSKHPRPLILVLLILRRLRSWREKFPHMVRHSDWICIDEDRIWCTLCNKTISRKTWKDIQ